MYDVGPRSVHIDSLDSLSSRAKSDARDFTLFNVHRGFRHSDVVYKYMYVCLYVCLDRLRTRTEVYTL